MEPIARVWQGRCWLDGDSRTRGTFSGGPPLRCGALGATNARANVRNLRRDIAGPGAARHCAPGQNQSELNICVRAAEQVLPYWSNLGFEDLSIRSADANGEMVVIQCPMCHSRLIRRSKRQNLVEYLLSTAVFIRPYRCVECDWRFFRWSLKSHGARHITARHGNEASRSMA